MEKEIDLVALKKILDNNTCAFLCGNGFSMNFSKKCIDKLNVSSFFQRFYHCDKMVPR